MTTVNQAVPSPIVGRNRIMLAFSVLLIAALAVLPLGLSRYQLGLAAEVLIYGTLAMSIDILAGFAGRTSLAHGAIFGVSAYVVVYVVSTSGLSPLFGVPLGIVLGVVAATLVAALFSIIAVRTSGVYFLLITLALGMIIWGICLRWTDVTGGENGLRGDLRIGILRDPRIFYWITLAVTTVLAFAMWRLVRSPFGLTLRGIRDSESRMRSLGYDVQAHLFIAFTVSGFFAGAAGVLYAFFNSFVSPTTVALAQSVQGLLMAITGGIGTLFGSFVGSAAILTLQNVVSSYTERWQTALGLTFILVMIFAPNGLVGLLRSLLQPKTHRAEQ
jgi:branched-chain amino acid transport system permease protein